MLHTGITGSSLSGKSTLARKLGRHFKDGGRGLLVLDEMMDPKWISECGADVVTDDPAVFEEVYWSSRNLAVFIDEAGASVGRYNKAMILTATRGRHWGHINHYLVQAPSMLAKDVRRQWGEVYAFVGDESDGECLKREFIQPKLLELPLLKQGEYIHARRFGPDRRPYYEVGDIFA